MATDPSLHIDVAQAEQAAVGDVALVQTVPVWAVNGHISAGSLPKLIAVHLTAPAGTKYSWFSLASTSDEPTGDWRAAIYDAQTQLPIATTHVSPFSGGGSTWITASLNASVPRELSPRGVWVVVALNSSNVSIPVVNTLGSQNFMPWHACTSSYSRSELPVRMDSFVGFDKDGRIPLLGFS